MGLNEWERTNWPDRNHRSPITGRRLDHGSWKSDPKFGFLDLDLQTPQLWVVVRSMGRNMASSCCPFEKSWNLFSEPQTPNHIHEPSFELWDVKTTHGTLPHLAKFLNLGPYPRNWSASRISIYGSSCWVVDSTLETWYFPTFGVQSTIPFYGLWFDLRAVNWALWKLAPGSDPAFSFTFILSSIWGITSLENSFINRS